MNDTLLREPEGLLAASFDYSNFDHEMPTGAEKVLHEGKHFMEHTAWDHYGVVWFADGQFHERVMRYHAHVATISGETLRDVIDQVNDQYGSG